MWLYLGPTATVLQPPPAHSERSHSQAAEAQSTECLYSEEPSTRVLGSSTITVSSSH